MLRDSTGAYVPSWEAALKAPKVFFEERKDQSEIKARIVQKYFFAWAKVISPTAQGMSNRIAYIDLYAGPGRYKDGSASTPLLVLSKAIEDTQLRNMLVALFNDADANLTETLQKEIDALPGVATLTHKPEVRCGEVDDDAADFFVKTHLIPSFSFVDPFGYKGLSLKIINGVIKDWGCDCLFFFNYNRINAGLGNDAVASHMNALFGEDRANQLRAAIAGKTSAQREIFILEGLAQAIKALGGKFVLPFKFKNETGSRTSHSLIFVSKHFKGYEIMKDIMAKESSTQDQGVASFTYSPADASTPLLFSLARPAEALADDLMGQFAGQTLTLLDIYKRHSVDTPYVKRNYKDVCIDLESKKLIDAEPSKRRKGTFADTVLVTFPEKKHGH